MTCLRVDWRTYRQCRLGQMRGAHLGGGGIGRHRDGLLSRRTRRSHNGFRDQGDLRVAGTGTGERDRGQRVDELGGYRGRHCDDSGARCRSDGDRSGRGGGELGEGAVPGGDPPAGEHSQAERERLGTCVQGSVTQLFVAGVEPATGNGVVILASIRACARFSSRGARRGSRGRGAVLLPGRVGRWVSGFWTAVAGSGPALARSSGGARARRSGPRSAPPDPPAAGSGRWPAVGRRTHTPRR